MRQPLLLTIPVLACALAACSGGDDDKPATGGGPARTPEATATPAPEPVMLGSQRYLSPCSVLPLRDAERIYGRMTPRGYVRQEFFDDSLSKAEFRRATDTIDRSVATTCEYNRRDRRSTSVRVEVSQYRSERAARAEWASIAYLGTGKESRKLARESFDEGFGFVVELARENERKMGGRPVRGMQDVLYVKGRADFVGVRRNAVIRVAHHPLTFQTPVFSPQRYRRQAAKARKAFRTIFARLDRGELSQAPGPAVLGREKEVNGRPYLDPCAVLDERIFRLATGRGSTEAVESVSLVKDPAALREDGDSLFAQSAEATCNRHARYKRRERDVTSLNDRVELSVRVAARPQGDQILSVGTELAGDWMIDRYVNEDARDRVTVRALMNAGVVEQVTADETEADALFVFDSTRKTGRKDAFRNAFFNVGPYAFFLDVDLESGLGLYSSRNPGVNGYRRVVDAIAADVRAAMAK